MKLALCVVVVLAATCAAVSARNVAGGAVLAPVPSAALESFLEAGAHTDAEIEAMARAQVAAVLGEESDAEAEAEAGTDAESAADAEADAEMPRDTKAEEAREKRRARAAARAAAAAARASKPVPPPNDIAAAVGGDSDIVRLVYDELQRMSAISTPAAVGAAPASSLGVTDPRISTLEHRLTQFESARAEREFKAKNSQITALATRLEGLDKTLAALKKSQDEQQALSARLLKATKKAEAKQDAGNAVDYSVGYVKATLPKDFEVKVNAILKSVKTEARKIYERYCKRAGIKALPEPKSYPTEGKGAAAPAPAATAGAAAPATAAAAANTPSMKPLPPSADPAVAEAAAVAAAKKAVLPSGKAKKLLFAPLINGKEPTPEGMRLSKALNDISMALPVTPAYQLSSKEKALHEVLGESSVNAKWKTPRF